MHNLKTFENQFLLYTKVFIFIFFFARFFRGVHFDGKTGPAMILYIEHVRLGLVPKSLSL